MRFITSVAKPDGDYADPYIRAWSYNQAQRKADTLGVRLEGWLPSKLSCLCIRFYKRFLHTPHGLRRLRLKLRQFSR
jgi:hypothetical protein